MNAHEIMNDFQNIFLEHRAEAESSYCSNKDFTTFITKKINAIIGNKFKTQNEYFRIDAMGWTPRADSIENTEGVHLSKHLWDLEIAIEHENNQHDWMDEVVKLAHIFCPLRVVIGYLPWKDRKDGPEFDLYNLHHVSKEIKKLKCCENMRHGEFLVILGNCNTAGKTSRYFGYRGYLFNPTTFEFDLM